MSGHRTHAQLRRGTWTTRRQVAARQSRAAAQRGPQLRAASICRASPGSAAATS